MARKRYILALSLALAAIAPTALVGCGGSLATPTVGGSTPGAAAPITSTVPSGVPTAFVDAPLPVGTGVPASVPTTQP